MRTLPSLLLLWCMVGAAPTARGDEPVLVLAGSRLRLRGLEFPAGQGLEGPGMLVGTLVAADDEALTLQPEGGEPPLEVPWSGVDSLEVSTGKRSGRKAGGFIGAALGAVLVGLVADPCFEDERDCSEAKERLNGAAWGALVYGFIGGVVGSFVKTEQWVPASRERVRIGLAARPGGIGVGLSVTF